MLKPTQFDAAIYFTGGLLPGPADGMGFGVKDYIVQSQRPRGREQQIEVFESFCEDKALH